MAEHEDRPHTLIVTDPGDGSGLEWQVIHHSLCQWGAFRSRFDYSDFFDPKPLEVPKLDFYRKCLIQHEIDNNGLDSLDVHTLDGDAHLNSGVELGPFEADYKRLRPGRYKVVAWCTPQGWAGSEPVDADGGLYLTEAVRVDA